MASIGERLASPITMRINVAAGIGGYTNVAVVGTCLQLFNGFGPMFFAVATQCGEAAILAEVTVWATTLASKGDRANC